MRNASFQLIYVMKSISSRKKMACSLASLLLDDGAYPQMLLPMSLSYALDGRARDSCEILGVAQKTERPDLGTNEVANAPRSADRTMPL